MRKRRWTHRTYKCSLTNWDKHCYYKINFIQKKEKAGTRTALMLQNPEWALVDIPSTQYAQTNSSITIHTGQHVFPTHINIQRSCVFPTSTVTLNVKSNDSIPSPQATFDPFVDAGAACVDSLHLSLHLCHECKIDRYLYTSTHARHAKIPPTVQATQDTHCSETILLRFINKLKHDVSCKPLYHDYVFQIVT